MTALPSILLKMVIGVAAQLILIIVISTVSPRIDPNAHVMLSEQQEIELEDS